MRRRLLRKRSLAILILVNVVCFLIYISGKLDIVHKPAAFDAIRELNVNSLKRYVQTHNVSNLSKHRVQDVNCAAILDGDKREIERAKKLMNAKNFRRKAITEKDYIDGTKNCDNFKMTRGYNYFNVSQEERSFPIAYSILLYKEVEQAERLLRTLYTPQNVFCLHVDGDSAREVHLAVQGIADCFDNVFVVSRKEYVIYAGFTRLQADLNCMDNLLQRNKDWKYFLNLPSQEFPLKTNLEMVKILKIYNGANDVEGITGRRSLESRFKFRYIYKRDKTAIKAKVFRTNMQKGNPPGNNITVIKGSAYGIFSRNFVEFALNDKVARELLDWFRDVLSPDEYFWATLNFNPQIGTPGSFFKGKPDDKPWLAAYAAWGGEYNCHGKYVRGVCVFGVGDLVNLRKKKQFFANKVYLDYQPFTLDCLEEWHFNRSMNTNISEIDINSYRGLPFIGKSKN